MLDVSQEEVTSGSVPRVLALLALPLFAQNTLTIAAQVVDTFWVGRLGDAAVAAVGTTFPVISFLYAAAVLAPNTGVQVLVSQRHGGGDDEAARRAAFHGLVAAVAATAVVAAAVAALARPLLSLLALEPGVLGPAATYLSIRALGLPVSALLAVVDAAYIAWGDTRAAAGLTLVSVATNLALDPLLIFGVGPVPRLGVAGAAVATVVGYVVAVLVAAGLVAGLRDSFTLTRESVGVDRFELQLLFGIGLPDAGRRAGRDVVRLLMYGIVSAVGGTAGLAAYVVGARIASVAVVPAIGLMEATQSVIGQNLGAARPDRAGRTTWVGVAFATVGLGVVGAVQLAVPEALTTLFVPDAGSATLRLSVLYLEILALGYWGIGVMYVFMAAFNGSRRTTTSMVADYLKYWAVRLPVAAAGAYLLGVGVEAAFWAVTVSNVVGAVGLGVYYVHTVGRGMLERAAEVAATPAD